MLFISQLSVSKLRRFYWFTIWWCSCCTWRTFFRRFYWFPSTPIEWTYWLTFITYSFISWRASIIIVVIIFYDNSCVLIYLLIYNIPCSFINDSSRLLAYY